MRLEDDPSIGACACPWCGSAKGTPCVPPPNSPAWTDWNQSRLYIPSHMARLRKAEGILARRSLDGRLSRKTYAKVLNQLGMVAGEISKRMRRGKISLRERAMRAPAIEKVLTPFMEVSGLLKLISYMPKPNER